MEKIKRIIREASYEIAGEDREMYSMLLIVLGILGFPATFIFAAFKLFPDTTIIDYITYSIALYLKVLTPYLVFISGSFLMVITILISPMPIYRWFKSESTMWIKIALFLFILSIPYMILDTLFSALPFIGGVYEGISLTSYHQ